MCTLNEKAIRNAFEAPILEDVVRFKEMPVWRMALEIEYKMINNDCEKIYYSNFKATFKREYSRANNLKLVAATHYHVCALAHNQ